MKFKRDKFDPNMHHQKNFDEYIQELFNHSILNISKSMPRDTSGLTEYKENSMGYRSKEFLKKENMIVAGCSFTYGLGISEELTWAHILSNKINEDYVNLAHPGISIEQSVVNVISYCEKFGNPEYIFCLFPPLHRFTIPNTEMLMDKNSIFNLSKNKKIPTIGTNQINEDLKKSKYFKEPNNNEEIK